MTGAGRPLWGGEVQRFLAVGVLGKEGKPRLKLGHDVGGGECE